jgi:hypothetical protein
MPDPYSAGVGALTSIYGLVAGASQINKGKRALKQLDATAPMESLPEELLQNQQLATLRANTGLPSEQYSLAMKNIQRQQLRSLRRAGDRGGGLGLVAALDDNANRATGALDAQNAAARINNEKTLMGVNSQVGNFKSRLFNSNVRMPWQRKYDYNMGLVGAGHQNQANAVNSLGLLAGSYLSGGAGKKKGNNMPLVGDADSEEYNYENTRGFNP